MKTAMRRAAVPRQSKRRTLRRHARRAASAGEPGRCADGAGAHRGPARSCSRGGHGHGPQGAAAAAGRHADRPGPRRAAALGAAGAAQPEHLGAAQLPAACLRERPLAKRCELGLERRPRTQVKQLPPRRGADRRVHRRHGTRPGRVPAGRTAAGAGRGDVLQPPRDRLRPEPNATRGDH